MSGVSAGRMRNGGEQRFAFDGTNDDAAASGFHLGLYPADSVPPDGFAPSHVRGRWDLRDSLSLEADMYLRRGQSAISGSDDPHTSRPAHIGMRRGGEAEFRVLCGTMSSAATLINVPRPAYFLTTFTK